MVTLNFNYYIVSFTLRKSCELKGHCFKLLNEKNMEYIVYYNSYTGAVLWGNKSSLLEAGEDVLMGGTIYLPFEDLRKTCGFHLVGEYSTEEEAENACEKENELWNFN